MQGRFIGKTMLFATLVLALALAAGCGGSSGDSSTASSGSAGSGVSGSSVVNPLLVGATISAKDANGTDALYSSSPTTATGAYSLVLKQGAAYPVVVSFTGGTIGGAAFNGTLKTIVSSAADTTVYASTLSTLTVSLYEQIKDSVGDDVDPVQVASGKIYNYVAQQLYKGKSNLFDIFSTPPVAVNATSVEYAQNYRVANKVISDLMVNGTLTGSAVPLGSANATKVLDAFAKVLTNDNLGSVPNATVSDSQERVFFDAMRTRFNAGTVDNAFSGIDTSAVWTAVENEMDNEGAHVTGVVLSTKVPSAFAPVATMKKNIIPSAKLPARVSVVEDNS